MRLTVFNLFVIATMGCSSVERPNADICVINAPGLKLTCYNMRNDYDNSGNLKPGVQPHFKQTVTLYDVNKFITMSPDDFSELKAYVGELKDEYERGCK